MPPRGTPQTPEEQEQRGGIVLFGRSEVSNLPTPIAALVKQYNLKTREIPGVAPTWKVEKVGDMIAGICVRYREGVGKYKQNLVVLETKDGFKSVWLSADLKAKIDVNSIGRPMVIEYQGTTELATNKGNPMKVYRVIEIVEGDVPTGAVAVNG